MTAAAILARAEAAGVTVEASGDRLRLVSNAPPPAALLHDLAGAKAELLALLERRADEAVQHEATQGEPLLPPVGSAARERLDTAQQIMVAGLLMASRRPGTQ